MSVLLALAGVASVLSVVYLFAAVARPRAALAPANAGADLQAVRMRLVAQLRELDSARADESMDAAIAADEQARLEYELAQVLRQLDTAPTAAAEPAPRAPRLLAGVGLFALPMVAAALYWSQQREVVQFAANYAPSAAGVAQGEPLPPQVLAMVARLEQRLKEQPNDAAGWAQLGRSYGVLDRRNEALKAYERAYALAPEDTAIISDYAWLIYSGDPRSPALKSVELYSKLYRREPDNVDAQWVLGLAAFQAGRPQQAIALWEKLLRNIPAGSPAEAGVRQALEQVKAQAKPAQPSG